MNRINLYCESIQLRISARSFAKKKIYQEKLIFEISESVSILTKHYTPTPMDHIIYLLLRCTHVESIKIGFSIFMIYYDF